ncbi:MAG: molecular chaperone Hsp33 [Rhodospirillaceae bacterium]|nr:molecular chaperone Hsp33 [Rhodospirillaceae bacterium]MBT5050232.1 molecular chaperone Hsp33 [Rhodospirillaceae bacterium]MBT5455209.1 molecular chaperone Hsp33 [Rhodospirillaceae bacterium]
MTEPVVSAPASDNLLLPFQIESMAAQGRLVRLGDAVQAVLGAHDYPESVARLLGEAQAIAGVIAGTLKFDGVLTFQIKGDGPITILVVDVTSDGAMRGYAQFDLEKLSDLEKGDGTKGPQQAVPRYLGNGYLALTVDQGQDTQRYQGIVPLEGATLTDCAHTYFRQSVQLDAVIKVAVDRVQGEGGDPVWRAGGILLQRLEQKGVQQQSGDDHDPDFDDAWRRAVALLGSCTSEELVDPALQPNDLLYRLFNEDGVRVFDPSGLVMRCRCSRDRVENVLRSFPRSEIASMKVGDDVVVTCEFCNADYRFDPDAIEMLYAEAE